MAKILTKGKTQVATQLDTEILTAFRTHIARRGEKFTHAVERIMAKDAGKPAKKRADR